MTFDISKEEIAELTNLLQRITKHCFRPSTVHIVTHIGEITLKLK